jgi:hypothetical protein
VSIIAMIKMDGCLVCYLIKDALRIDHFNTEIL